MAGRWRAIGPPDRRANGSRGTGPRAGLGPGRLGSPARDWCPFDQADSEFVVQLERAGHEVVRSHIAEGRDFYRTQPRRWDILVSNPPFTNKAGIFRRALSFGKPFALLMTLTWLNDAAPKRLFRERALQLLMFEERVDYGQGDKITFSSAYFCCDLLSQGILVDSLRRFGMGEKEYGNKVRA